MTVRLHDRARLIVLSTTPLSPLPSDPALQQVDRKEVVNANPHILFYSRRPEPAPPVPSFPSTHTPGSTSTGMGSTAGNTRGCTTPAWAATASSGPDEALAVAAAAREAAGSTGAAKTTLPSVFQQSSGGTGFSPEDGDDGSGGVESVTCGGEERGELERPKKRRRRLPKAREDAAVNQTRRAVGKSSESSEGDTSEGRISLRGKIEAAKASA